MYVRMCVILMTDGSDGFSLYCLGVYVCTYVLHYILTSGGLSAPGSPGTLELGRVLFENGEWCLLGQNKAIKLYQPVATPSGVHRWSKCEGSSLWQKHYHRCYAMEKCRFSRRLLLRAVRLLARWFFLGFSSYCPAQPLSVLLEKPKKVLLWGSTISKILIWDRS